MSNFIETTRPSYHGSPILASSDTPCRSDVLQAIEGLFDHAMRIYSKVLFLRFDLRHPDAGCDVAPDVAIGKFRDSFVKNRARNGYRPLYVWCREQSLSRWPHYHFVLLLDGQKTRSIHGHLKTAREMWYGILGMAMPGGRGGLLDPCDRKLAGKADNGIMIRSSDPNAGGELREAYRWASYLAKTGSKGNGPKGTREWGCSRVPNRSMRRGDPGSCG